MKNPQRLTYRLICHALDHCKEGNYEAAVPLLEEAKREDERRERKNDRASTSANQ